MGKAVVKDAAGVEYGLQWNVGELDKVTWPERGKRNGRIEISVPGFKHKITGSFDNRDTPLAEAVRLLEQKARMDGPVYVAFRLEVHRDEKHDKAIPFEEIPTETTDRHRRFTALAEDQTPAGNDLLLKAEAEAKGQPDPATGEIPGQPGPVPNQPAPPEPMPSGGTQCDTYAFSASVGAVTLAFEILQEAVAAGVIDILRPADIKPLAERFGRISDAIQVVVTDGKVNRNANSHTRARGILRTVIEAFPAPITSTDQAEWEAWENRATRAGIKIMLVSSELHQTYMAQAS